LRLLLDSNAFLWAYARPEELSTASRHAIVDIANDRWVSIASLWEIAIKLSIGKLSLPNDNLAAAIAHLAVTVLPISVMHVGRAQTLPFHHRDPFDRLMIAQAMEEGLTIVTRDRHFPAYGVPILAA
jgi:PIN domain nuclease of toxin-antitoxin system